MKNSEILREARAYIESGYDDHVCVAIRSVRLSRPDEITSHQESALCAWVMALIGDTETGTYSDWLMLHYPALFEPLQNLTESKLLWILRPARLAWMDWMIAHWDAKGE